MQLAGSVQFSRTMAAPISAKRLLMVGALVVVVAMLAAQPTEASNFEFFLVPGCLGSKVVLDACGCSTIPTNTRRGFKFTYTGQTAAAYNGPLCTGVASTRFSGSSPGQCTSLGWQSVFIQC